MKKDAALPRQRQHFELQRRLDNHFQTCSACAGAIALAVTSAEGGIVYSGPENVTVPFTKSTAGGLSIDLDTGTFSTAEEVSGFDLLFTDTGAPGSANLRFTGGAAAADGAWAKITKTKHKASSSSSSSSSTTTASVQKLNAGRLITAAKTFGHTGFLGGVSSSSSVLGGFWDKGGTGYVGFQFVSAANTTLYGWVQLAVGADLTTTVVDWAYDDSGKPILAGLTRETKVHIRAIQPGNGAGGASGAFRFVRKGDLTIPIKVNYSVDSSSTAISGTDYEALPGSIVIPAGKKSVVLPINALGNSASASPRTITMDLGPGRGFDLGKAQDTVVLGSGQ